VENRSEGDAVLSGLVILIVTPALATDAPHEGSGLGA
jgi:hypothetical protein